MENKRPVKAALRYVWGSRETHRSGGDGRRTMQGQKSHGKAPLGRSVFHAHGSKQEASEKQRFPLKCVGVEAIGWMYSHKSVTKLELMIKYQFIKTHYPQTQWIVEETQNDM